MALKEVCIAARTFGPGRAQEGDIIVIRDPLPFIGTKEGKDFIWLLIDESQLPSESLRGEAAGQAKFRYQIPLAQIAARFPTFSLNRARDKNEWYQPFRDSDPRTGLNRANNSVNLTPTDKRPR